MANMKSFVLWVLTKLPEFLMAEPICYFVGLFFLLICIIQIKRICKK